MSLLIDVIFWGMDQIFSSLVDAAWGICSSTFRPEARAFQVHCWHIIGKVRTWLHWINTVAYNFNFQQQFELLIFEPPGSEQFPNFYQSVLDKNRMMSILSNSYFPYYLITAMNKFSSLLFDEIKKWPIAFVFFSFHFISFTRQKVRHFSLHVRVSTLCRIV